MVNNITKDDFSKEVISSDKTVLVDFYATWCGPCKALAPVLENIAENHPDDVKVFKVNVDEEEKLAIYFGITVVPTVIIFKNGQTASSFVGLRSASEIEKMIEKLL